MNGLNSIPEKISHSFIGVVITVIIIVVVVVVGVVVFMDCPAERESSYFPTILGNFLFATF